MRTPLMINGNFDRSATGGFTMLTEEDAARQVLANTLKGLRGEWFLNNKYFVDWLSVLDKPFTARIIDTAQKEQLLKTGIVQDVILIYTNLIRETRKAESVVMVKVDGNVLGLTTGGII